MKSLLFYALIILGASTLRAQDNFKDYLIQSPKLEAPKRGSLKGDFASLGINALSQKSGSFTIDLPIAFPTERGAMPYPFKASYSPSYGISELGIGWSLQLKVYRHRELGKINYQDDDLIAPWGRMVKGNDGFYYTKDLRSKIRAKIDGATFTAFMPDGSVLIFGDEGDSLVTEKNAEGEVFAWYLKSTRDQVGHECEYHWQKFSENGKSYLQEIEYGGIQNDFQYKIAFTYAQTGRFFVDFSASKKIANQKLTRLTVLAKDGANFSERYRYNFLYAEQLENPGFYLTQMQKVFISGVAEPAATFTYDMPREFLMTAQWLRDEQGSYLANRFRGLVTTYEHTAFNDFNNDGRLDLEIGYTYENYYKTDTGFEKVELPAPQGPVSNWCLFPVIYSRKPRQYLQLKGPGSEHFVYDVFSVNDSTVMDVCHQNGERVKTVLFPKFWDNPVKGVFADLNGDNLPDRLHLKGDSYEVSYNESTESEIRFSAPTPPIQMFFPSEVNATWFKDINADGYGDLVLKGDSTIYVHYGLADGSFEKHYVTYDFYLPDGSIRSKDLKDSNVLFIDVNKDSLPDILLQGQGFITLHINSGSGFIQLYIPGLFQGPHLYNNVVVANITGLGESQIINSIYYNHEHFMLSLNLDRPGLGMLKMVDDGKGNQTTFEYQKAAPQVGVENRKTVVSKIKSKTVGDKEIETLVTYQNIHLHNQTKSFLGFEAIESTQTPLGKTLSSYQYDEHNLDRQIATGRFDVNFPDFVEFEANEYEEKTFEGITSPFLVSKTVGKKNQAGTESVAITTSHTYSDDTLCTIESVQSTDSKALTTTTSYAQLPNFQNHLACLASEVLLTGSGINPWENFSHKLNIERDSAGRPTVIKRGLNPVTTLQTIAYGNNGLVSSVEEAGKGLTSLNYDESYRLDEIINPDQTKVEIASFESLNDAPLYLQTVRDNTNFVQEFRYDQMARLERTWDNLGRFSFDRPNVQYKYAFADNLSPSKILERRTLEPDSSSYSSVASVFFQTGRGDDLGSTTQVYGGQKLINLKEIDSTINQTRIFQNNFFSDSFDLLNLKMQDFNYSENHVVIGFEKKDFLGQTLRSENLIQEGTSKVTEETRQILNNLFSVAEITNQDANLTQTKKYDGWGDQVAYLDEENNQYGYSFDSMKRIRKITFPDNTNQLVTYDDNLGKVSRIERGKFGAIEYTYSPTTTLLEEKRIFDKDGILDRKENYEYDSIGRMLLKLLTKGTDVTEYQFLYDGTNLPVDQREGQRGFLTGVQSAQFSKTFKYRVDGKKTLEMVTIPGYKELKLEYSYYSHGAIKEEIKTVTDLSFKRKNIQTTSRMFYVYTGYGDPEIISRNGVEFAYLDYTSFGELDTAYIANIKSMTLAYDPTTRIVKNYREELGPLTFVKQDFNYSNRGLISESNFKFEQRTVENAYSYSPRGFLQTASTQDSENSSFNLNYSFDSIGLMNSEIRNGTQTNHAITETSWQIGNNNYQLDTLGRVIQKNSKFFIYGENGRIKSVAENATNLANYFYDEENNPLLKVYPSGDKELYFNDLTIIKNDFYEPLKIGSRLVGHFKNNNFINNSFDHLSTTLVDEEGQVNLPTPFGERDSRTELFKSLDFTSKGYDNETGAVRMGQRYYDPIAKRFLTPDSLFVENSEECSQSPIECNLYSYAGNSPVANIDPSGEFLIDVPFTAYTVYLQQNPSGGYRAGVTTEKEGRYIDPAPRGLFSSQQITFKNDNPHNPSSDQKVSFSNARAVESAARLTGQSFNINSTTGGHTSGAHPAKNAVDINMIDGKRVGNPGNLSAVKLLQGALAVQPETNKQFGPAGKFSSSNSTDTGRYATPQVPGHDDHIHNSVRQEK
ncbi:MAG: hypothetical protein HYV97_16610 [Bdellovibrio sp.]|nr:hypothetical protein [Bdellovibrio sp.]